MSILLIGIIFAGNKKRIMASIKDIQEEIIDEFSMFEDWMQRYEYMIDLGKSLPLIDDQYKTDEYIIKGCQSKVWVHAEMKDEKVHFTADSDAIITKGIIAILIRAVSGQSPQEILDADTDFIDVIGLKEHLSVTRANGLVSMIKQIKLYAVAYQTQLN
jgi:cysteine desulfuration protein SufE